MQKECVKYNLHQIRTIHSLLTTQSATTLLHVFIWSKVGYGNTLNAGLILTCISQLQRILNAANQMTGDMHRFWQTVPNSSSCRSSFAPVACKMTCDVSCVNVTWTLSLFRSILSVL